MSVFNNAEDSQTVKMLGMTMGGFVALTVILIVMAMAIS